MVDVLQRGIKILPYLFVFIASLYLPTDPDLGWHLKYGEYFFQHHQLLRDNIFSTMMSNYQWANGSWGTDIITYALYKIGGFLALSLAGAFIVTLTFFFAAKAGKKNFLSMAFFFPLFIFMLSPVNSDAFRGQQLSYLFLAILLFLLSNYKPLTKRFLFIPLLFLLWVNIHEETFLFLTMFGAWGGIVFIKNIIASYYKRKSSHPNENIFLLGIFLVSFSVTFVNPFGAALLCNAFSYLGNDLVTYISEYQPYTVLSINWWMQIMVTIVVIVFLITTSLKKKFDNRFLTITMTTVLLLLGFSMRRYLWPAYYMALTFISIPLLIKDFHDRYGTILGTVISLVAIVIAVQYKLPFTQFTTMSWDTYCTLQMVPCSPASARFLEEHKLTNNIFSYYDWGGWLIWNYPDVKPSIDGRMHIWKDANGYNATTEYAAYVNKEKSINKSSYDIVYLPNDTSPLALEVSTLIQQKKWKTVYVDDQAGIAVRVKNN